MKTKQRKPSWWLPIMMMSGMIVLIFLEAVDHALLPVEPGIEIATILAGFALLEIWIHVNSGSLQDENHDEYEIQVIDPAALSHSKN